MYQSLQLSRFRQRKTLTQGRSQATPLTLLTLVLHDLCQDHRLARVHMSGDLKAQLTAAADAWVSRVGHGRLLEDLVLGTATGDR